MELRPWMERITIRVGSWNASQMVVTVILVIAVLSPLPASSVGRDLAVRTTYYVLLVASWNLLAGYAGLYSFGHVAFAAIGAYTTVLLADTVDLRPAVAFLAGGAVAAGVGILLGLLSSRIRGPYLVVASFGLLVAVQTVVLANPSTTGGAGGSVVPVSFMRQRRGQLQGTPPELPVTGSAGTVDDRGVVRIGPCRALQIGERRQRLEIRRLPVEVLFVRVGHHALPQGHLLPVNIRCQYSTSSTPS